MRYALRSLARSPGFALAVILTLATWRALNSVVASKQCQAATRDARGCAFSS